MNAGKFGTIVFVGIYDMLRVELSPNGAFNGTEFGTVKDPNHFKALSPRLFYGLRDRSFASAATSDLIFTNVASSKPLEEVEDHLL